MIRKKIISTLTTHGRITFGQYGVSLIPQILIGNQKKQLNYNLFQKPLNFRTPNSNPARPDKIETEDKFRKINATNGFPEKF